MTVPLPDDEVQNTQASRIYFLPNLMTAGNLFCGFVAIIKCIQARLATNVAGEATAAELYSQAVWFILAAVIFDSLDGRLARLGGKESLFGKEFDSIADIVSFGVAPALMVFFQILSPKFYPFFQQVGWFIGFVYLLCAGVRLARFNVLTHPGVHSVLSSSSKDFIGLPVPAAAGQIASLVLFLNTYDLQRWALVLPGLMLLIAYLMVSTIRYPSFKEIDWQTKTRFRHFIVLFLGAVAIFLLQQFAFVLLFLAYIFYGLIRHGRRSGFALKRRKSAG